MAKKKKASPKKVRVVPKKQMAEPFFFMNLTKSQTRSLAVGIIIAGFVLFILAGLTWKSKNTFQATIFPTAMVSTKPFPTSLVTPTGLSINTTEPPTKMISATSTARLKEKQSVVKALPNTSSNVTYTVEADDSLAKIGKRLCADDRAWLSIAETNNLLYPYTIHPGETYIITCN